MNVFKYSHLSSKISAMKGNMLSEDDYQNMMFKRNVSEIAAYLKNNTYYSQALKDLNDQDVHRDYLEMLLYRAEISDVLKIARYLKGNDKEIYRYVYRRLEIEDLKKMLRTLQMGRSLDSIDRRILFISKYSKINFDKALMSKNIIELIESVKGTNFYNILKPLVISENQIDLFSAEMALDLYYYRRLTIHLNTVINSSNIKTIAPLFTAEADFRNIVWIYRGKKYYNLNKEILYRYIIPLSYKIKKQDIIRMVEAKDEAEIISIIHSTYYKNYLGKEPNRWEHEFLRYLLSIQQIKIQKDPYSLAPIVGYVIKKETEIFNIIAIIEGVRYKVTYDEIKKQLIVL